MKNRFWRQIKKFLRRARHVFFRCLGWLLAAATLLALAGGAWLTFNGWLLYREAVTVKSIPTRVEEVRARADYVALQDLPDLYPKAVVAVEDNKKEAIAAAAADKAAAIEKLNAEAATAAETAKAMGIKVITLTGETGGKLKAVSDVTICVPSCTTFKIQEYHLPIYHALCAMLEAEFFGMAGA